MNKYKKRKMLRSPSVRLNMGSLELRNYFKMNNNGLEAAHLLTFVGKHKYSLGLEVREIGWSEMLGRKDDTSS